jgi:hypothetical protein
VGIFIRPTTQYFNTQYCDKKISMISRQQLTKVISLKTYQSWIVFCLELTLVDKNKYFA